MTFSPEQYENEVHLFKDTIFISQDTLKARKMTDWHYYHLMINITISLMFCAQCNLYLMNHQANCSSYTKLKFQLCEENAKLHLKKMVHTIIRLLYKILIK